MKVRKVKTLADKMKTRFKGHESFILREGWLNKGLTEVNNNPKVFSNNFGADDLGVGPNMAKSIRYWMRCAELTEEIPREGVLLTDLGKVLFEKDAYLEQDFSLWLVHCNIVRNYEMATSWNLFFNQFLYEEFDKKLYFDEMKEFAHEAVDGAKLAESSVESDCDAILHMYLRKNDKSTNPEKKNVSPFGKLGLLKKSDETYAKKQPDLNRLPEEIVLYVLLYQIEEIERKKKTNRIDQVKQKTGMDILLFESEEGDQRKSISIDDLLQGKNSPGKLLNLKRTGMMEMLARLEAKGHLTVNHTAGLDMVYLNEDKLTPLKVVEDFYN